MLPYAGLSFEVVLWPVISTEE